MNPLGNGMIGGLPQELMQNIQQIKNIMNFNPMQMLQGNPALNQVMQLCQGKNPEMVFKNMCKQRGLNPELIIKQLKG